MRPFYSYLDIILLHQDFHDDSCDYYWDICGHLFHLNISIRADTLLPGCFRPWTFSFDFGLNMLPSDSFMSCLHPLLHVGYSIVKPQALQLIVLAAFVAVD